MAIRKGRFGVVRMSAAYKKSCSHFMKNADIGFYYVDRDYTYDVDSYIGTYSVIWFKSFKNQLHYDYFTSFWHEGDEHNVCHVREFTDDEKVFVSEFRLCTETETEVINNETFIRYVTSHNYKVHVGTCKITFPKRLIEHIKNL